MLIQAAFAGSIEPKSYEALQRLTAYRNEDVLTRYMADSGKNRAEAEAAWTAFLQFMGVCMFKSDRVTATPTVDGIWHAFLLHTKQYANFCDTYMGGFVHHEPTSDEDSGRDYYSSRAYAQKIFGELDPHDWPEKVGRIKCYSARSPESRTRFN